MLRRKDLYWKRSPHEVDWFVDLMEKFPDMEFIQRDPWHIQCRLDNGELINFWPHVRKAMIQNEPPVTQGAAEIELLVHEARARIPDDFDVIE